MKLEVVAYHTLQTSNVCFAIQDIKTSTFYPYMYTEEWMANLVVERLMNLIDTGQIRESLLRDFTLRQAPEAVITLPQTERPKLRVIHPMHR